ncbi:MAG: hypothetical protein WA876_12635, partial [Candidatus Acidiferrales bacterium]
MSADSLARVYSTFLTYLAEPAMRSLAIGCVAAIALAAFRVQRVTVRLLTWTTVLCAALAMPFLGAFLPRLPLVVPAAPLVHSLQASIQRGPARVLQHNAAASGAFLHSAANATRTGVNRSKAAAELGFVIPKTIAKIAAARKVMRRPDDDFVNDNFRSGAESAAANVSLSPAPITADTTA